MERRKSSFTLRTSSSHVQFPSVQIRGDPLPQLQTSQENPGGRTLPSTKINNISFIKVQNSNMKPINACKYDISFRESTVKLGRKASEPILDENARFQPLNFMDNAQQLDLPDTISGLEKLASLYSVEVSGEPKQSVAGSSLESTQDQMHFIRNVAPEISFGRTNSIATEDSKRVFGPATERKKIVKQIMRSQRISLASTSKLLNATAAQTVDTTVQESLGKPTSRHDAQLLENWFTKMLNLAESTHSKQLQYSQIVHNLLVKELARQVGTHCVERGLLVTKAFESYLQLLNKVILKCDSSLQKKDLEHRQEILQLESRFETKLRDFKSRVRASASKGDHLALLLQESEQRADEFQVQATQREEQLNSLNQKFQLELQKTEVMTQQLDFWKTLFEVEMSKHVKHDWRQEYNYQIAKQKNDLHPQHLMQKILDNPSRSKTDVFRIDSLKDKQTSTIDFQSGYLGRAWVQKEVQATREAKDGLTQTQYILQLEKQVQTDWLLEEEQLDLDNFLLTKKHQFQVLRQPIRKCRSHSPVINQRLFLRRNKRFECNSDGQDFIIRLNDLRDDLEIQKLKKFFTEEGWYNLPNSNPDVYDICIVHLNDGKKVTQKFLRELKLILAKERASKLEGFKKKINLRIKKTQAKMQLAKKLQSRPDHPSFNILEKFLKGQIIPRETMSGKAVVRIINQSYQARAAELKEYGEEANTISMLEWLYDSLLNKYGIQKIAERKFISMLASCNYYKVQSDRIRLFGRMLGVYNELTGAQYLKVYFDIVDQAFKQVLNFTIQDTEILPIVPLSRGLEIYKLNMASKISNSVMQNHLQYLRKNQVRLQGTRPMHLQTTNDGLALDVLAEKVLDTILKVKTDKLNNINEIFQAGDLEQTGFLTQQTLIHIFQLLDQSCSEKNCIKFFKSYSTDERGLDEKQFQLLCKNEELFSVAQVSKKFLLPPGKKLTGFSFGIQDYFEPLLKTVIRNQKQICAHLTDCIYQIPESTIDRLSLLKMVEQLQNTLADYKNAKVAYLTYKLVFMNVSNAYLDHHLNEYALISDETMKFLSKEIKVKEIIAPKQRVHQPEQKEENPYEMLPHFDFEIFNGTLLNSPQRHQDLGEQGEL